MDLNGRMTDLENRFNTLQTRVSNVEDFQESDSVLPVDFDYQDLVKFLRELRSDINTLAEFVGGSECGVLGYESVFPDPDEDIPDEDDEDPNSDDEVLANVPEKWKYDDSWDGDFAIVVHNDVGLWAKMPRFKIWD